MAKGTFVPPEVSGRGESLPSVGDRGDVRVGGEMESPSPQEKSVKKARWLIFE